MNPPRARATRSTGSRRSFVTVVAWVVTLLVALPLGAEPSGDPEFRFDFQSDVEGCPDRERVESLVVARLGFDPFVPDAEARIRIELRSVDGQLEAHIERSENGAPQGQRTLHDSDCGELAASAALAASIMIDPLGALAKRHAERNRPAPNPDPTPADDPFVEPPPPPPAAEADPWRAFVAANVLGSVGLAPAPALGFNLGAGVRWRRLVLRLEGRSDLPVQSDALADGSRAASSVLMGSLVPCFASDPFQLCGVFSAGAFLARSQNVVPSESAQTLIAGAGLRPVFDYPLVGPLHVSAQLEALVLLKQITLTVRGTEVWTSPPLAFSAGAGIRLDFL